MNESLVFFPAQGSQTIQFGSTQTLHIMNARVWWGGGWIEKAHNKNSEAAEIFFFLKKYLFLWLHWALVAAHGI